MSSYHIINYPYKIDHKFTMGHNSNKLSYIPIKKFQASNAFQSSYHDLIEAWLEEFFRERFPLNGMPFFIYF